MGAAMSNDAIHVTIRFVIPGAPDRQTLRESGLASLKEYVAKLLEDDLMATIGDLELEIVSAKRATTGDGE